MATTKPARSKKRKPAVPKQQIVHGQGALCVHVDRDGITGGIQVAIGYENGRGYRLAGPKYNGSSERLLVAKLAERDANEIRGFLNEVFQNELLEALEQALLWIESDETTHGRKYGTGNVARAAIAKARGKSVP